MTPSGIETATFRFVAQCLNHRATTDLYNAYWVIPGDKVAEVVVFDQPRPSNAEVEDRVELYPYSLSGFAWLVLG